MDWKYRGINEQDVTIQRLSEKLDALNAARPLPNIALNQLKEALAIEWTYNSNSIEGNTLTLRETQMVIEEGVTIRGKSLKEHFETHDHSKALNYLYSIVDNRSGISSGDILSLHQRVMINTDDDFAGRIRNGGVRIGGANFTPPNASKVSDMLDELMEYVTSNPDGLDVIKMATVFHHKFVWIHPFFDGNGRTVRLAMNLFLIRNGFPPAIILATDRKKYYAALQLANKQDIGKLLLLMCQSLERSLNLYLGVIPGNTDEYEPISNIASEPDVPYGQEYLSLLARQGKIDAHKEGRVWYTTRKALNEYLENRQRIRNM
jgi:Fic family protein